MISTHTQTQANAQLSPQISRELLQQLSDAVGVSGDESQVRQLILARIKDRAEEVTIDPVGNMLVYRKGTGGSPLRVLVSAHMDETGLMVSEIGDNGLIHVLPVGTLDFRYLPARRVWVGAGKTPGVLLWPPIHKTKGNMPIVEPRELVIDVGADNKSGVRAQPGDRVAFASAYTELTPTIARGKAFESRAGCAALIALLEGEPFPFDFYGAFTVQAAIGGRGAAVAAFRADPHLAFALAGITANDLPRPPDSDHTPLVRLGGGPVLSAIEGRIVADRRLVEFVRKTAESMGMTYQFEALLNLAGQGFAIGRTRAGVPFLTLGMPVRYIGSPNELIDLTDVDQLVMLLRAALTQLTPDIVAL